MALSAVDERAGLVRGLKRLLRQCRALQRSALFPELCGVVGGRAKTVADLAAEATRRLALADGAGLSPAERREALAWTAFHLCVLDDLCAAVAFFEAYPAGQALHVA